VRKFPDKEACEVTIGSLYDGHHFGDVAMIDTKTSKIDESRKFCISSLDDIQDWLALEAQMEHGSKSVAKAKIHNRTQDEINWEIAMKEDQKKDHYSADAMKHQLSIYTAEHCEFMIIDRKKFKEILVSVLQEDVNEKMKILKRISIFRV
jgi:hypothetical protein